jgi:hypothetical protein
VAEENFVGRAEDCEVILGVGNCEVVVTELCVAEQCCLKVGKEVCGECFGRDIA